MNYESNFFSIYKSFSLGPLAASIAAALRKQAQHQGWSLEGRQLTFALFSQLLSDGQKARIARKIIITERAPIMMEKPAFPMILSSMELEDFVNHESWLLFDRICPNYDWVKEPPPWDHHPEFQRTLEIVVYMSDK